jgi:murein DD-endopeptidase MepM/ murein hydrolase activator NlpD
VAGSHPFRRLTGRVCALIVFTAIVLLSTGLCAASAHGATVDSDRAEIAQIQKQIAAQGAQIESLVQQSNAAAVQLDAVRNRVQQDAQVLTADQTAERAAQELVRHVAVLAYMGDSSALTSFQDTASITQMMTGQHYLSSVNSNWNTAIAQLTVAHDRTSQHQQLLLSEQSDAQHALGQLTQAKAKVNAAIANENAQLSSVRADLTSLLITQQQQKAAAARSAAEHAIAAALAQASARADAAPSDPPTSVPAAARQRNQPPPIALPPPQPVTGGGYANPLRSVGGLSGERIDEGVDYAGIGPVYAIGNGTVVNVYAAGWPGGTFIAYQLSDGPARGLYVYTAEDINPAVSVGSTLTANTVIGQMYGGPNGIEIGWADGSRIPDAMARSTGQSSDGSPSAFGYNFSRLMQALGAPGGVLQGNPNGTLPPGWPQW